MTVIYLVQHGEKEPLPGDPGLTGAGRDQALRTARWMRGVGLNAVMAEWDRSTRDRDYVPGGVTVDLLRTLLGDGRLPRRLIDEGVPPCAITTVHNLEVIEIASVAHLPDDPAEHV
jgi:hypothetical protein